MAEPPLLLASTSRYRAELLARLRLPFRTVAPEVAETERAGETAESRAARLAELKADAVARHHPGACVIGSDQVASLAGRTLGKPGSSERACEQLLAAGGREVLFHTAVCVLAPDRRIRGALDTTVVRFRTFERAEIERYVALEQPLDCAGSFKAEGLGIALFERIESTDPTGLIGLPLIALARLLREVGYRVP